MISVSVGIVCYSRPLHLTAVLESLLFEIANSPQLHISQIIISQDCAQLSERLRVRGVVEKFSNLFEACGIPVKIIEQENRIGLKKSILLTLASLLKGNSEYFMLLEDDIVLRRGSLNNTLQAAARLLAVDERIVQYSMFSPVDVPLRGHFVSQRLSTWGWISKTNRFPSVQEFESIEVPQYLQRFLSTTMFRTPEFFGVPKILDALRDGRVDIWSLNFMVWMIRNEKLTAYPLCSQIQQIGFDGSGQNCGGSMSEIPEKSMVTCRDPGSECSDGPANIFWRWCHGLYYTKLGALRRRLEQWFY